MHTTSDSGRNAAAEADAEILNHVIEETAPLYWNDFIKLVYSTYPILANDRYAELNLEELARRYKKEQRQLKAAQ